MSMQVKRGREGGYSAMGTSVTEWGVGRVPEALSRGNLRAGVRTCPELTDIRR